MGCKRIIDGKSYNTDTAALVHEWCPTEFQYEGLYQTKHGAFFLWWYDAGYGAGGIKPMSDDEAQKWLEKRDASAAIIEQYFGNFPEAGAAESRITLRLPGNLYNRVSASAAAAELSMNTYIMRLLERNQVHPAIAWCSQERENYRRMLADMKAGKWKGGDVEGSELTDRLQTKSN